MKWFYTLFFIILTYCILTHSDSSLYYAVLGLELWFDKMIPALFPFMILSGIMIRMQLTESIVVFIYPIVGRLFRISRNACYALLLGFLCGFPMGAKTVADLYARQRITAKEAEFLLAFCNNIGPVYFAGFVLPLLQRELLIPYLIGMYGIPILYGLILRYTIYRNDISHQQASVAALPTKHRQARELVAVCNASAPMKTSLQNPNLLQAIDESITSSVQSILSLGGYMILFNLMNLLPHILLGQPPRILAPLFEISGGLYLLQQRAPLYTLLLLPFGGLSCIAQTNSCIRNTDLSIVAYTLHKLLLTGITAVYYLLWYWLFPDSFLR